MTRHPTLAITLCTLALAVPCLGADTPRTATPDRPNVLFIMSDDHCARAVGAYGLRLAKLDPTPNLDRLASEGMRFTDFHSSGPVCSPTRAGLMTGRYQQRAGIPGVIMARFDANRHHGLQIQEITFAEQLKSTGYTTAIFGKWHLGYS